MSRLSPAFHRHPEESALIGRLLVGFGELEFLSCWIAKRTTGDNDHILKALYKLRATSARITTAEILSRPAYEAHGLGAEHRISFDAVSKCLNIRNQYAHCNWADDPDLTHEGLFFADLQVSAKRTKWELVWRHTDLALLTRQDAYFVYAQDWLHYIEAEIRVRNGVLGRHDYEVPAIINLPPPHNPASQHIPPWLSSYERERHLEDARADEADEAQPIRPPSILKLTLEDWMAKSKKEGWPWPSAAVE